MKINFVTQSSISKGEHPFARFLTDAAKELSEEYDTNLLGQKFLLYEDSGREILQEWLQSKYNLNCRFWKWMDGDNVVASGIDVLPSKELTGIMLKYDKR